MMHYLEADSAHIINFPLFCFQTLKYFRNSITFLAIALYREIPKRILRCLKISKQFILYFQTFISQKMPNRLTQVEISDIYNSAKFGNFLLSKIFTFVNLIYWSASTFRISTNLTFLNLYFLNLKAGCIASLRSIRSLSNYVMQACALPNVPFSNLSSYF